MFTGIVDHQGRVESLEKTSTGLRVWISCQFGPLDEGESLCTDGVCLTVADTREGAFCVDVSPETCDRSRFASLQVGDRVNLERSLRVGDRMGGHYVTGHVDQVLRVARKDEAGEYFLFGFSGVCDAHRLHLIEKGSVTINGVSLTVNAVNEDGFEVMLIPHTLQRTNLGVLEVGQVVNAEFDWMSKVISQQVQHVMEQRS
ncbi:MAG: riboflavin synthase [Bdellovibrionales bacterium]|nr:riboflavin synthase [Bdellovibrionales bacterium]